MPEKTHWKKLTNPNYMGDYSLPTDGGDLIVTIKYVRNEEVQNPKGFREIKTIAYFQENDIKPMILNKTNMNTIAEIYGTPYVEEWQGRAIQIYYDKTVRFSKKTVGGLRIRPFVPEKKNLSSKCSDCSAVISEAFGKPAEWVAQYTYQQYGKPLCAACAQKIKEASEAKKAPDAFGKGGKK